MSARSPHLFVGGRLDGRTKLVPDGCDLIEDAELVIRPGYAWNLENDGLPAFTWVGEGSDPTPHLPPAAQHRVFYDRHGDEFVCRR